MSRTQRGVEFETARTTSIISQNVTDNFAMLTNFH